MKIAECIHTSYFILHTSYFLLPFQHMRHGRSPRAAHILH